MGLRGAGGVNNFCLGICDGAPSTAHSSFYIKFKWVQVLSYINLMHDVKLDWHQFTKYFQVTFIDCYLREIISFTKKIDIRDLGQSRCEDCYVILKSRLKYVWCCENFNIRYGEMVLERLQSIFCISSVTKQNVLHYPTLRMKVSLEINLGCLIHPL